MRTYINLIHVYVHTCMHAYIHIYVHAFIYMHAYIMHTTMHAYIRMYLRTYIQTYTCLMCTFTHTGIVGNTKALLCEHSDNVNQVRIYHLIVMYTLKCTQMVFICTVTVLKVLCSYYLITMLKGLLFQDYIYVLINGGSRCKIFLFNALLE